MLRVIPALLLQGVAASLPSGGAVAQTVDPIPMLGTIDPGEYMVGPGDVFWFSVQGGLPTELTGMEGSSFANLTVTPDGYLVVPTVGSYYVSGMTLAEAVDMVEAGFSSRFPGLRAGAGLAGVRRSRIPVTGQVGIPGLLTINGSDRLTDLLAAAGGIDPSGSWTGIRIIHAEGDTTFADITGFYLDGIRSCNPLLRLGDRVDVPRAERFVYFDGAFQSGPLRPVSAVPSSPTQIWTGSISGMTEYIPGETVGRFVDRIGGTSSWASRQDCVVERIGDGIVPETLAAPLDSPSAALELLPGDRVVCPGVPPLVAVSGLVATPGVVPHVAGMGAMYYVSQAGGCTLEASRAGIRVVLPDGTELEVDEIDDVPAGATITVPRQVLVWWQDPLLIVTSVATVIVAWRSID